MRASLLSWNRRRAGAIVLAVVAIAALVRLRTTCEIGAIIAAEVVVNALLVIATGWVVARSTKSSSNDASESIAGAGREAGAALVKRNPQTLMLLGATICVLFPLIANWVERRAGQGTGVEIAFLGALAWGGLVASIVANRSRTISISVVCSGFLTLFTTVSSDDHQAVYFAFAWGIVCLWWLIANHWERIEGCQIDSMRSTKARAPLAIIAGSLVFVVAAWSASGRSVMFNRLTAELMPTSGGTGSTDAQARSGVGSGDAVVAARDHAASFGAVETDVFLDSPQPSLFDMFNDQFGEPVRKKKNERAIALSPRENQSTSSRTSQSNSSTQSFTTQRSEPKPRKPLKDIKSNAIMFWIGRVGERLATERFTHFDGIDWHEEKDALNRPIAQPKITSEKIGERVWFGIDPNHGLVLGPYVEPQAEAVKFTRFRSNRIPAPAGLQMWHIDLVDQADFFGFAPNQCLEMPGRDHVPDYTTVRLVNRLIDLEKLIALTAQTPSFPAQLFPSASELRDDAGVQLAKQTVSEWLSDSQQTSERSWKKVQLVIDRLRREFKFERDVDSGAADEDRSPLEQFLTNRRGNDVMFATAAAVMLREIGFRTRFVTGFYVDPSKQDRLTGQTALTASDAHAWLEVDVGMDTWIPLEPTPGYLAPTYRVSWAYRLKENAAAINGAVVGSVLLLCALWFGRAYVIEGWLRLMRYLLPYVSDRRRVRWLVKVLDCRCKLAGISRPKSISPRDWLRGSLALDKATWAGAMARFFSEADRLNYGGSQGLSVEGRQACVELWRDASTFCLRRLRPSSERESVEKRIHWNGGLEC